MLQASDPAVSHSSALAGDAIAAPCTGLPARLRGTGVAAEQRRNLAEFIREAAAARAVVIDALEPIYGGAVRRHWRVRAAIEGGPQEGRLDAVLRAEGETNLGIGLALPDEFALLRCARHAGVCVPEPLFCCADPAVFGSVFHLTRWLPGSAAPELLVGQAPDRALAAALGAALAAIHALVPPQAALGFLGRPAADAAAARMAEYRRLLDAIGEARPAAEWGLRWLADRALAPVAPVLCHGDFRTGNYLVADGRLAAILDWEFAGWGDPDEDIAWFCSRFWRFGAEARAAGGIAGFAPFRDAYEARSGRRLDPARLRYWRVMAALKWLVIALLQRDRYAKGGERALDLALTGRRAAECEYEILRLTAEEV